MYMACFFGHQWSGCTCVKCGQVRDEHHEWDGCRCYRCGKQDHNWNGEDCTKCGRQRLTQEMFNEESPFDHAKRAKGHLL